MKQTVFAALAALACSAALAQAPAGTTPRPPSQVDPTAAGGAPAAKAETKKDAKTGAMPMASGGAMPMASGGGAMPMTGGAGMGMGSMAMMKGMDANGDGMISKKEYERHHAMMWNKMNPKKGMVPMADVEAMLKGGPN